MNRRASNIIDFWFVKTPPEKRFKKDEAFDLEIRDNFIEDYHFAKSGEYEDWLNTPKECLALIILLDQFSRNLFRDKKEAFDQEKKIFDHFIHLVIHSMLHILGYTHEDKNDAILMESKEIEFLPKIGVKDPYK